MCRKTDQKELLKSSILLQKDTVRLQKDLEKVISDQTVLQGFGNMTASSAELQILLVKVRVSLKSLSEILQKSQSMEGELQYLRDAIASDGSQNEAALQERLQSLQVTGVLLSQIEAEAQTFAAAYGELESSLEDAGKAVDEARTIQMQNAVQRAVKLIREAAEA